MASSEDVAIGAFGEEHAARLCGASIAQLREWDRIGIVTPSYGAGNTGLPYGRVYSFRDIVSLRVVSQLRNVYGIRYGELRSAHKYLSRLSGTPWASCRLEVLGKRVVVVEPGTRRKREPGTGQEVLAIPLRVVIASLREDVRKLNERPETEIGKVVREKFVAQNQLVIAGTRIPIAAIKSFASAGYDAAGILKEFPDLTAADVQAALAYEGETVAA